MLCQVPEDYYLKQFEVTITSSSSLWVVDEFIINGKSSLQSTVDLTCDIEVVKPPVKWLNVAICDLQVHWLPSTTYKFRFTEDFYREVSDGQPNPQFDITYTTNPLPTIPTANPAFGDVNAVNNTTIRLDFDRRMRRGDTGNIYLYEVASPSDILLETYSNLSDITFSEDGASISFSTLGLMKSNTEYYILTDERIFRDYDNFYLPQITDTNFYTFRTDESEQLFPDLITIQFVTGDVAVEYIRYRNQSSNFSLVDSDISISDQYRLRRPPVALEPVISDMVSATTYNTGKLRADFPVSIFDAFDIFTTYNTGKLRSNIDAAYNIVAGVGVRKPFNSSISAEHLLSLQYIRNRDVTPLLSTSEFSQVSESEYGVLQDARAADTYSTNTTTTLNNGPRFEAKITNTRTGTGFGYYTMVVRPNDLNAVNTLNITNPYYERTQTYSGTSETNMYGQSILSDDGNVLVAQYRPIPYGGPTLRIFRKQNGPWSQTQTIDLTYLGYSATNFALSGDGNVIAITNQFESSEKKIYIYRWNGSSFEESNIILTGITDSFPNNTYFGYSISLSYDGSTMAVGRPGISYSPYYGYVYIYTYSGSSWSLQATLSEITTFDSPEYGYTVSLSNDGNTLAVGAPHETVVGTQNGAVFVYTRSGTTWTLNQKITTGGIGLGTGHLLGQLLDLSSDGLTLITKKANTNNALVYVKSGGTWSQQQSFTISNINSLTLSNAGNTATISSGTTDGPGATAIYSRTGTTWSLKLNVPAPINSTYGTPGSSGSHMSEDDSSMSIQDGYAFNTGGYITLGLYAATYVTWNNLTKTLTFSGTRTFCRTYTDLIQLVPATGYTNNYIMIYTGTIPDGRTTTKNQNINRI